MTGRAGQTGFRVQRGTKEKTSRVATTALTNELQPSITPCPEHPRPAIIHKKMFLSDLAKTANEAPPCA